LFIEVLKEDEEEVVQTFSSRRDWYIFRSPLTSQWKYSEDGIVISAFDYSDLKKKPNQ